MPGAWTGEISPPMLNDCGLDLVELGHSERREHFGETDRTVGLKTAAALRHGLIPLICVGETLAEREAGRAEEVLACAGGWRAGISGQRHAGQTSPLRLRAGVGDWRQRHSGERRIRRKAAALISDVAAASLGSPPPVLYGGSVNPGNAAGVDCSAEYRRALHRPLGLAGGRVC